MIIHNEEVKIDKVAKLRAVKQLNSTWSLTTTPTRSVGVMVCLKAYFKQQKGALNWEHTIFRYTRPFKD
jgi:hypothetical protein